MGEFNEQQLEAHIFNVNQYFYEGIYNDSWLKRVFAYVKQEFITEQQTLFMFGAFGGPKKYCGRSPKDAHPHIYIDEEMWQLREKYLIDAFNKANTPDWMRKKWLAIDEAFKVHILKKSPSECVGRYKTEQIIDIPNPNRFKKSA
jgi:truncated hemoglobin YjbI